MSIDTILKMFYPNGLDKPYNKNIIKKNPEVVNLLKDITNFLEDATISERLYCLKNEIKEQPKCECGNNVKFKNPKDGYAKFCSRKCMQQSKQTKEKRKKTFTDKYGGIGFASEQIIEKARETNLEKYGVSNPTQNKEVAKKISDSWSNIDKTLVKEKREATNLKKYGVKYHQQDEERKEALIKKIKENNNGIGFGSKKVATKIKNTNLEKFGVENPMQHTEVRKKLKETMKLKYGVNNIKEYGNEKWNEFKENFDPDTFILEKSLLEMEKEFGVRYYTISNFLQQYGYKFSEVSSYEQELRNILPDDFEFNNRTILNGKELDFYSKERNLAIEFNGILYHSEKYGKGQYYHFDKTEGCLNKGVKLLHIFENEWLEKKEIVQSIINRNLGIIDKRIYARKCVVKEVEAKEKNIFLEANHIQGKDSSSIKIGLFYDDELVQILTFGHSRFNKKFQYEMHRSCSKKGYQIIGGLAKMWKYFLRNYNPESVITYADRRYFDGRSYEQIGFTFSHTSKPNFWIFGPGINGLDSRLKWQKHKQKDKLAKFDPELTAWNNMINNGYNRIWDSGNNVYIWRQN